MRSLLAALLLLLLPSTALGASGPPPGLAGTLAIVAQDANSVTLHAEQTGGIPVTLKIEHVCYNAPETAWRVEKLSFTGSVDATFSLSPFTFKGNTYEAARCWATLNFYFSGSRVMVLAYIDTLP